MTEREFEDQYIDRDWDDLDEWPYRDDGYDEYDDGWYEDDYSYLDEEEEELPFGCQSQRTTAARGMN